jgi:predicted dehydrogenase
MEVSVVGCGVVAHHHLAAWKKVRGAHVVAICDVNEDLARRMAQLWKVPEYYSSLTGLLERRSVNVIDICSPPQFHAPLAVQAMKAKSNVLIEKPLTMTSREAEEIVNCQRKLGLKVGVMHNWLYEPPVIKAVSMFERGDLGEVLSMEVAAISPKDDFMTANPNHWSHTFLGGRFSEMLPHPVYLLQRFLGDLDVEGVSIAKLGPYSWMKADELCAVLKAKKKLGRVYVSFNAPRDAILMTIYGSKAVLRVDIIGGTTVALPAMANRRTKKGFDSLRQSWQLVNSLSSNALNVLMRRWKSGPELYIELFAKSVRKDLDPPVDLADACATVRVCEQICHRMAF